MRAIQSDEDESSGHPRLESLEKAEVQFFEYYAQDLVGKTEEWWVDY